ncbi:transposase [Nocardia sp. NPDC049220]|uniref:transposase n=1 Tax=Nocardia sp. NPDC049220 TaxID=3155273 RepID=UPI0033DB7F63
MDSFVREVFSSLTCQDPVVTAGANLRGLMLDVKRKSMRQMAELPGIGHQWLQQLAISSPEIVISVRKAVSRRVCDLIYLEAWVLDGTGFVKGGNGSPCVARQYSGTLSKVGNCRIGIAHCDRCCIRTAGSAVFPGRKL